MPDDATSLREPRISADDAAAPAGFAPALGGTVPAAESLTCLVPDSVHAALLRDCAGKTAAEWWAASGAPELMVRCLPTGDPGSPARRKLVALACHLIRAALKAKPPEEPGPVAAFVEIEGWTHGRGRFPWVEFAVNWSGERGRLRCVNPLAGWLPRIRDVAEARFVVTRKTAELIHQLAQHVSRTESRTAAESLAQDEARSAFRRVMADTVREEYPDIAAILVARQSELSGR